MSEKNEDQEPVGPYTDCHCHLADRRFESVIDQVIQRARNQGVSAFVQGGVDPEDWERQKKLRQRFGDQVITAFGLHPLWVARVQTEGSADQFDVALEILKKELPLASALGEIGMDLRRSVDIGEQTRDFQKQAFRCQLELLRTISKPLVLHIVRAHGQAISILEELRSHLKGGIVHSFSGSRENAKKYLDLGFSLSISGGIARAGYETLKKAVAYIPIDRLLVETDSPDQAIHWEQGFLNEPTALFETARALAEFRKGESAEQILRQSTLNAERIFR